MGKKVFANGMEIVHKAGTAVVTAAFPDVCLSPPSPPAGPVPLPYPDSSKSDDLQEGTTSVSIGGKPAGIKDSYYQTSPLGNEAATRSFGGSVITHTITGKTYFAAHSMDVSMEGASVVRHLDLTTSNHGSYPGGTPPFPNLSEMHQLALDRIQEHKCPCCGSPDCPAAFQEGEEPLSMKEALGLDPGRPNYNARRANDLKGLRSMKKKDCSCDGQVFPKPPCDVFREPDPARTRRIEGAWDDARAQYQRWYSRTRNVELRGPDHFLNLMMAALEPGTRAGMVAAMRLPRAARAANPLAQQYEKMATEANQVSRVNHLTPKQYGGCPTNPDNLQPQQTLCATCQEIDQFMTDNW